jgi:hypothetical protein
MAHVIVPPVSCEDETTSLGAVKVVLVGLLILFGIITAKLSDGIDGNTYEFKSAAKYKEQCWLMLVGDGLWII